MFKRSQHETTPHQSYPRAQARRTDGPLVSMGEVEHAYMDPKTKKWKVTQVELFFDLRHTARKYIRFEGDTALQPLFETSGNQDQIERFEGQLRKPECSAFEPSMPDTTTKVLPVPVTPDNPHGRLGRSRQPNPYGV